MYIRLLTKKDLEDYRFLRLQGLQENPEAFNSSYEEEKTFPIEKYERRINDSSFTFGAYINEQLVGVTTLVLETRNKIKHRANISGMYVHIEKRHLGIGKSLMLEVIKKAKNIGGIEQIYLSVTSSNLPAKTLYSTMRFQIYGKEPKALKINNTYYDVDLMVLPF